MLYITRIAYAKRGKKCSWTWTMINAPDTLLALLRHAAERHGDAAIYRYLVTGETDGPQETLSARALMADAQRIGAALAEMLPEMAGVQPRAILVCSSPIEFARAFFGCL